MDILDLYKDAYIAQTKYVLSKIESGEREFVSMANEILDEWMEAKALHSEIPEQVRFSHFKYKVKYNHRPITTKSLFGYRNNKAELAYELAIDLFNSFEKKFNQ